MTLQDVNNSNQDGAEAQELSRRREPADRLPSKSEEQARWLAAITELVQDARANGDSLTGPSGLLKDLTKMVLEVSLEEEMTEHLGHGKHDPPAPAAGTDHDDATSNADERIRNVRNGSRTKTVLTDNVGRVEIQVVEEQVTTFDNGFVGFWLPRDVEGTIEVIYDGRTGQSNFSTSKEGATCLTTLQLGA